MGSTRLLEPRFAGFGRREGRIWAQEPRFAGFGTAVSAKPRNLWLRRSGGPTGRATVAPRANFSSAAQTFRARVGVGALVDHTMPQAYLYRIKSQLDCISTHNYAIK